MFLSCLHETYAFDAKEWNKSIRALIVELFELTTSFQHHDYDDQTQYTERMGTFSKHSIGRMNWILLHRHRLSRPTITDNHRNPLLWDFKKN